LTLNISEEQYLMDILFLKINFILTYMYWLHSLLATCRFKAGKHTLNQWYPDWARHALH
jgi:hypothetical protein